MTTNWCSGMIPVLPRVLRSPEPHHPHPLVVGARGGLRVVATLGSVNVAMRRLRRDDRRVADELIRRRAEIDRLEAEFAQLAWVGTPAWDRRRGRFTVDPGVAASSHRDARRRRTRVRSRPVEVCELLPKVGAAWRDGEITGGAAKTIAAARVEGHDLKLRALEDVFLIWRARTTCASCGARVRTSATVRGPTAPSPREHDGLTISDDLRRDHGRPRPSCPRARPRSSSTAIHAFTDPPSDGDTRTAGPPPRRRPRPDGRSSRSPHSTPVRTARSGRSRRVRS